MIDSNQPAVERGDAKSPRIDHINIVVANLEAMLGFYRDLLGMEIRRTAAIGGAWLETVTGIANANADVVILGLGGGSNLELIQYQHTAVNAAPERSKPDTLGIRHIAFQVDDIDALLPALSHAGIAFLSEPTSVHLPPDANGTTVEKRIVYLLDPERNLLELCSYLRTS